MGPIPSSQTECSDLTRLALQFGRRHADAARIPPTEVAVLEPQVEFGLADLQTERPRDPLELRAEVLLARLSTSVLHYSPSLCPRAGAHLVAHTQQYPKSKKKKAPRVRGFLRRARLDSNQGPRNYEFPALTAELRARQPNGTR